MIHTVLPRNNTLYIFQYSVQPCFIINTQNSSALYNTNSDSIVGYLIKLKDVLLVEQVTPLSSSRYPLLRVFINKAWLGSVWQTSLGTAWPWLGLESQSYTLPMWVQQIPYNVPPLTKIRRPVHAFIHWLGL